MVQFDKRESLWVNVDQIALGGWRDPLEGILSNFQPSFSTCPVRGGWTFRWIPK